MGEGARPLIYRRIPQISVKNNIYNLIYRMIMIESNLISVYQENNFIGVIFLEDVLNLLISAKSIREVLTYSISKILSKNFPRIELYSSIDELIELLKDIDQYSPIIVFDKEDVLGYIYVRELIDNLIDKKYIWIKFLVKIGSIKLFRFLSVRPNSTVKSVIKLFKKYRVSMVPVTWRGRVKGIITQKMLAQMLLKREVLDKIKAGVNGYFLDTTCTTIMDRNFPYLSERDLSIEAILDSVKREGFSIILSQDERKIIDIVFDINIIDFIKEYF